MSIIPGMISGVTNDSITTHSMRTQVTVEDLPSSVQQEPDTILQETEVASVEPGAVSHDTSKINQLAKLDDVILWLEHAQSSLGRFTSRASTKHSNSHKSNSLCCV